MTRNGKAQWQGDLTSGSGRLTVGDGRWTSDYSFNSRFQGVLPGAVEAGGATNPEELLATAHAACFSMALALNLTEHGYPPKTIETQARVHLGTSGGIPAIERIDLQTQAEVPDLAQPDFQKRAEEAKATCILSRALAGVQEITLSATLV